MTGAAGWEQGLKKDASNTLDRAASTDGSARSRMAANAGRYEPSAEPLVCPRCRTEYETGLYCVDCDVELVGASFVDTAPPVPRRKERAWVSLLVMAGGILLLVGGLVVLAALGSALGG